MQSDPHTDTWTDRRVGSQPRRARMILDGKTAIVTGASSGIGAPSPASCRVPACKIVLIGRDAERLAAVRDSLARNGHLSFICDFDSGQALDALIDVLGDSPVADILVHAAGTMTLSPHTERSIESLDAMCRVNLHAPVLLTAALLPKLIAAQGSWPLSTPAWRSRPGA